MHSIPDVRGKESKLIDLLPEVEYQEIEGFGGAFTESAAVTLKKPSAERHHEVLKLYFSSTDGIGYNTGRVHMNSRDFSEGNYACVEEHDDQIWKLSRSKNLTETSIPLC